MTWWNPLTWLDALLGPRIPAALLIVLPPALQRIKRFKKGKNMDPITAIFNFLATPAGQKVVTGIEGVIQDLLKLFHSQQSAPPAVTPAPAKPAGN